MSHPSQFSNIFLPLRLFLARSPPPLLGTYNPSSHRNLHRSNVIEEYFGLLICLNESFLAGAGSDCCLQGTPELSSF